MNFKLNTVLILVIISSIIPQHLLETANENDDHNLEENSADDLNDESEDYNLIHSEESLKRYRKLFVNDMEVLLDDTENEVDSVKAYYKDDLLFECEIPEDMNKGVYDWSVNGYFLGLNESSYTLILDKKIESNSTFLNISCYFQLNESDKPIYLKFPTIHLGN